jgi:hypothetical protein
MNEHADFDLIEEHAEDPGSAEALLPQGARPRAGGAPLDAERDRHAAQSSAEESARTFASPRVGHGSEVEAEKASEFPSLQRAAGILRTALPVLQRLLPLLDGNVATVVGNLLASRANRSSSKVDLKPVVDGLAELRSQQRRLRLEVTEQDVALKRVEDQIETLRAVSSRTLLEQQEAIDDLRASAKKIGVVAVMALLLAAAAFAAALAIYLRMNKAMP